MTSSSQTVATAPRLGAQAVVEGLFRAGIDCGFGIPSIHNIAIYEGLRQARQFHHWVVRHEQAAGFAADGFYRHSGRIAAVFASTGPGNLFTLVPLLESLQTNIPVLLIGTNIASTLQDRSGGALHETPQQIEIIRPLTRFARRISSPDEIPAAFAEAGAMLHGAAPGPAFIEIPHDLLAAPLSNGGPSQPQAAEQHATRPLPAEIAEAAKLIAQSQRPVLLVGSGIHNASAEIRQFAERLGTPVLSTTTGKGNFPDDHPLSFGCLSRLGVVQTLFEQTDLLISLGARLTEFDTGRFSLKLPKLHLQIIDAPESAGDRFPATTRLCGGVGEIANALLTEPRTRPCWFDIPGTNAREKERLEALASDAYAALHFLRDALDRDDVLANDQSILNYWASAFFPVLEPRSFLYPAGSGTLGYGLPAAIGAACAMRRSGLHHKIVCIAGDGGFQYTQHELATLKQYNLPVKVLLVNDQAYGIIGFLQRSAFGQTYEVDLQNPDFCRIAEAYGIPATRAASLEELKQKSALWLESPGPALLEWRTQLKAPWEVGAINRPTGISMKEQR